MLTRDRAIFVAFYIRITSRTFSHVIRCDASSRRCSAVRRRGRTPVSSLAVAVRTVRIECRRPGARLRRFDQPSSRGASRIPRSESRPRPGGSSRAPCAALHGARELFYNDSSQLIEERTYTSNGDINTTSTYYYNDKNKLFKKEYISFGEVSATWIFKYDGKGNKITETQTSGTMGNTLTKYKYDDKSFLIQEDKSNNTIGQEERINYKYNEKGTGN